MEQTFLTDQEFSQITNLKEAESNLLASLGQVEYQLQFLTTQKSEILAQFQELEAKNDEIGKELQEKYGNGTINMETREFVKS